MSAFCGEFLMAENILWPKSINDNIFHYGCGDKMAAYHKLNLTQALSFKWGILLRGGGLDSS